MLQAVEETEEAIVRAKTPGLSARWRHFVEGPLLHGECGLKVDLRRLNAFVAQPERDDCTVHTGLQQFERHRMAKYVDGDLLSLEFRTPEQELVDQLSVPA